MKKVLETDVLIIGGGATGTGLARDLALRGLRVILAEKKDLNAGASGANHGLLHSGARYVHSDMEAAIECRKEGMILKQIAPQCIEETGGLFVAVPGDDEGRVGDDAAEERGDDVAFKDAVADDHLGADVGRVDPNLLAAAGQGFAFDDEGFPRDAAGAQQHQADGEGHEKRKWPCACG